MYIVWLDKCIGKIDIDLCSWLCYSEVWWVKDDLLCSILGIGDVNSFMMIVCCLELG